MKKHSEQKVQTNTDEKNNLHPRNLHRDRYDLSALSVVLPELKEHVFVNKYQIQTIDFADAEAVKLLNTAILMHFYGITHWSIPDGFLVPPVPGRADYIHYLADVLSFDGQIPQGSETRILDIGTGANLIYPIVGVHAYQWNFVGSDIDKTAIEAATEMVKTNDLLKDKVELRLQPDASAVFTNIIQPEDRFAAVMCNPPFHISAEEAQKGNRRKLMNLSDKSGKKWVEDKLNFGGQAHELWCEGGERAFAVKMAKESRWFKDQVGWFTCLLSDKENIRPVENALRNAKVAKMKVINMTQGQKTSRFLAWTFQRNG